MVICRMAPITLARCSRPSSGGRAWVPCGGWGGHWPRLGVGRDESRGRRHRGVARAVPQLQRVQHRLPAEVVVGDRVGVPRPAAGDLRRLQQLVEVHARVAGVASRRHISPRRTTRLCCARAVVRTRPSWRSRASGRSNMTPGASRWCRSRRRASAATHRPRAVPRPMADLQH